MSLAALKEEVLAANRRLADEGLARLTWGNVSGLDPEAGLVVIKPSGVAYADLRVEDLVVLRLEDGSITKGALRPSSDTPTHLALYRAWGRLGVRGICHTHSVHATMFAQAAREVPCLGTTHADHFFGPVPVCRALSPEEVRDDYEGLTGAAIVEHFAAGGLDPVAIPGVLQAYHAPFTWGASPAAAVNNALALETCAEMALGTLRLSPGIEPLPAHLLEKHHFRKHGPGAYYGQK